MKPLLQLIIVGLCAWFIIYLDTLLFDFLASLIPNGAWKPLLKVVIVVVMIIYTTGIAIVLITISSVIALGILDVFMPTRNKWTQPQLKRSRFQERLDEIAKNRKRF